MEEGQEEVIDYAEHYEVVLLFAIEIVYDDCLKAGALVQWLKLPAWKVKDRRFEPQNVSSQLTRKYSILWGASVTERWRARSRTASARILNPLSGGQCHLIHLTILRRFLARFSLYVHKGGLKPHSFFFKLVRLGSGATFVCFFKLAEDRWNTI